MNHIFKGDPQFPPQALRGNVVICGGSIDRHGSWLLIRRGWITAEIVGTGKRDGPRTGGASDKSDTRGRAMRARDARDPYGAEKVEDTTSRYGRRSGPHGGAVKQKIRYSMASKPSCVGFWREAEVQPTDLVKYCGDGCAPLRGRRFFRRLCTASKHEPKKHPHTTLCSIREVLKMAPARY